MIGVWADSLDDKKRPRSAAEQLKAAAAVAKARLGKIEIKRCYVHPGFGAIQDPPFPIAELRTVPVNVFMFVHAEEQ